MSKRVEKDMKKSFEEKIEEMCEEIDLAREEIIARHEMEEYINSSIKMAGWCKDYESSIVLYADQFGLDMNFVDVDPYADYNERIDPRKAALSKIKNTLRKFKLI